MAGETNLPKLLASMEPVLTDDVYVFATSTTEMDWNPLRPKLAFQEEEGTTFILERHVAEDHGVAYTFVSRMITLNIHSALDAVGFMAIIASRLANEGISVNPVSAYFHDHLFVPEEKAAQAMKSLRKLVEEHQSS